MPIDIFNNAHSTQAKECTSALFWEAVNKPSTKSTIEAIREQLAQGNKEAAANLKRSLPAVSWQGHSLNGRRGNDFTEPSGLYMLDIDEHLFTDEATLQPLAKAKTDADAATPQSRTFGADIVEATFNGRRISDIAQRYLEVNGRPDEGERHTYYVTMANHFRYICDNKAGIILCNLPDLGLSIKEREGIVNHAVKLQYRSMIPHPFYKFLESECIIRTRNNSALMDDDIPDASPDKLILPPLPPSSGSTWPLPRRTSRSLPSSP